MWDTAELAGLPSQAVEGVPSCPLSIHPPKNPLQERICMLLTEMGT